MLKYTLVSFSFCKRDSWGVFIDNFVAIFTVYCCLNQVCFQCWALAVIFISRLQFSQRSPSIKPHVSTALFFTSIILNLIDRWIIYDFLWFFLIGYGWKTVLLFSNAEKFKKLNNSTFSLPCLYISLPFLYLLSTFSLTCLYFLSSLYLLSITCLNSFYHFTDLPPGR